MKSIPRKSSYLLFDIVPVLYDSQTGIQADGLKHTNDCTYIRVSIVFMPSSISALWQASLAPLLRILMHNDLLDFLTDNQRHLC